MKASLRTLLLLSLIALLPVARLEAAPDSGPVVVTDFSNPAINPSHWVITLYRDGSGHFRSERGDFPETDTKEMDIPPVDREIHVSAAFAHHVFQVAEQQKLFNVECESHFKVAFQGWKKLSYRGPDGQGSCTFNYSKDKDLQALGDSLLGVAETILEGARLEMLLIHDRLGLDREMEFMVEASKDGRLREIGAIREILAKVEDDPEVLERVRKKARTLLSHAGT
jgi:hypothetical protein